MRIKMKDLEKLKKINVFEQYLTVWVLLCMVAGVLIKKNISAGSEPYT